MLRFFQILEVRHSPGDGGLPMRDRPDVPSGLGPVLVEAVKSGEGKNAVEKVVMREAEAYRVVLQPAGGGRP